MKETTNIKIDCELKKLYQSVESLHNLTIGEAAEIGMRLVLLRLNQKQIVEQEIKRIEFDICELSQKQTSLKILNEQLSAIKLDVIENKNNGIKSAPEELEKHRMKKLKELLKTPFEDWIHTNRLFARQEGKFADNEELEIWVRKVQE